MSAVQCFGGDGITEINHRRMAQPKRIFAYHHWTEGSGPWYYRGHCSYMDIWLKGLPREKINKVITEVRKDAVERAVREEQGLDVPAFPQPRIVKVNGVRHYVCASVVTERADQW
jgi:hypothetical protein